MTGILRVKSAVVAQIADTLLALGLTGADAADRIARRIRRTLNDERLEAHTCSQPVVARVLEQTAALLPAGVQVVVTTDRVFDLPPVVDRIAAHGCQGWCGSQRAGRAGTATRGGGSGP